MLDEINRLKNECRTDEAELQRIKETKDRLSHIADAEIKLNEFCHRVRQNLDNVTIQDKRLALEALDVLVTVSTQSIDIWDVYGYSLFTQTNIGCWGKRRS